MSIFWPKIIFSKLPKNMLFLGMENCILSLSGVRKVFWCFVKGTCLRLSWFPFFFSFFLRSLFPLDIWWFDREFFFGFAEPFEFFRFTQTSFFVHRKNSKGSAHPKKNSLSHHQMSFWKSSRQKKWKPASPKARPFSCTRKTLRTPERYKNRPLRPDHPSISGGR